MNIITRRRAGTKKHCSSYSPLHTRERRQRRRAERGERRTDVVSNREIRRARGGGGGEEGAERSDEHEGGKEGEKDEGRGMPGCGATEGEDAGVRCGATPVASSSFPILPCARQRESALWSGGIRETWARDGELTSANLEATTAV